jgi:hypothetical protein
MTTSTRRRVHSRKAKTIRLGRQFAWNQRFAVSQIKAARALLGWSQADLAHFSATSIQTIKRLEAQGGLLGGSDFTVQNIKLTIEASGIAFIVEPDGTIGVILRPPPSRQVLKG